jgi:RimJ/RimL family protein N-acetyltransferase
MLIDIGLVSAQYAVTMDFSDDVEQVIVCERVDLHHLSARRLVGLHNGVSQEEIFRGCSYRNPHGVLTSEPSPVRWRAPQVQSDPSANKWFIRWVVLKDTSEVIGSTSFHGPPDQRGMLEIGLGIHGAFQRQGFGDETLMGMWTWAAQQPGVRIFRYTVDPNNVASVRLIQRFGFTLAGQQIDDEDGPEDIYEMSVQTFRAQFMHE